MSTQTIVPVRPDTAIRLRLIEKRLAILEQTIKQTERNENELMVSARQEMVKRVVSKRFGLGTGLIDSRTNSRVVVVPRQIAMYLMYVEEGMSYPQIARGFLNKHHTTVLHGVRKIHDQRKMDERLNATIMELQSEIRKQS